jgi:glycerophosphoryl diester phosphodiesterase
MQSNIFKKVTFNLFIYFFFITSSAYSLPWIIAHRGGGQNFPENTLLAFSKSLEMGCDALELDVQVTKDGVVVVYHPDNLKQWTNGSGSILEHTWEEVTNLNAGYNFKLEENYPFRSLNLKIPKLEQVLERFPKTLIIIDMKSLPAENLVNALIQTISDEESTRLIFYSTNSEHLELLSLNKPYWKTFETRDITRQRLLDLNQSRQSELSLTSNWIGFELKRKMMVTETFALGKGTSTTEFHLWNPEVISYLKRLNPQVSLILFGINKEDEWNQAVYLNVDAIYTDDPCEVLKFKNAVEIRNEFSISSDKHML